MKRSTHKSYVLIIAIFALLIVAALIIFFIIKSNDNNTFFKIPKSDVAEITIQSYSPKRGKEKILKGEKLFDELLDHIYSFSYKRTEDHSDDIKTDGGGFKHGLYLTSSNTVFKEGEGYPAGQSESYMFSAEINVLEHDGIWYYAEDDTYFDKLIELVEENGTSQ